MLNKINKRGDKYYIMISLILGLIVLSLSLYFIFQEFFTQDMIDQESCRQSVYLRATLPEGEKFGVSYVSFKDDFPLKCKTQVFEITREDIEKNRTGKIIGETLVDCWGTFGKGDFDIFPMATYGLESYCVPCARIRLTNGAKKHMTDNSIKIDIEESLSKIGFDGLPYKTYLNEMGEQFAPFTFAYARDIDLGADKFEVDSSDEKYGTLRNRRTGAKEGGWWLLGIGVQFSKVSLPKYFEADKGDLLINYGIIKSTSKKGIGANIPYLFYFQIDQEPDPFDEVKKKVADADSIFTPITSGFTDRWQPTLCNYWEGIPA